MGFRSPLFAEYLRTVRAPRSTTGLLLETHVKVK